MESNKPDMPDFTCVRCFQSRPLKVVGKCTHRFCAECLSTVLQSQNGDSNVFPCPTCQAECPIPCDGVKGLEDFTGEGAVDVTLVEPVPAAEQESTAAMTQKTRQGSNTENIFVAKCQHCQYNQKDVQAANLCLECDDLYMCKQCTTVHGRNMATKDHELIALQSVEGRGGAAVCKTHGTLLKKYCKTCGEGVCKICVYRDHGDHEIEKLSDTIHQNVIATKAILKTKDDEFTKLLKVQSDLRALHAIARKVDRRDTLIKEIEDHAQRCIDQITILKEGLKEQAKADFRLIQDIPERLATVTEMVEKMSGPVHRAESFLKTDQLDQDPAYLQQLITIQQDLKAVHTDLDIGVGDFREDLRQLEASKCSFAAEEMPGLGKIDKNNDRGETTCTQISTHTLLDDANEVFIPCIANLGKNLYAVAQPIREGELSKAINIYDLTGTLKVTLQDHFNSVYDMSATTDNKLAVLCNGTKPHCCTVKVFDPEDGYKNVRSTEEMELDTPMSLAVGPENQFAVYGENMEKWRVGVFHQDGVELRYRWDSRAPGRKITWGGRFIFFKYRSMVDVYELRNKDFCHVKEWHGWFEGEITDISATSWDNFVITNIFRNHLELGRFKIDERNLTWSGELPTIYPNVEGADREARVSMRDDHIIVSHGKTIKVYELKPADIRSSASTQANSETSAGIPGRIRIPLSPAWKGLSRR